MSNKLTLTIPLVLCAALLCTPFACIDASDSGGSVSAEPEGDPMYFTAEDGSSISYVITGIIDCKNLQYWDGSSSWEDWNENTTFTYDGWTWVKGGSNGASNDIGSKLYVRNNFETLNKGATKCLHFTIEQTSRITVAGNIMSMIKGDLQSYCFSFLFNGCSGLIDASGLKLPTEGITDNIFCGTFKGCSQLMYGPELKATILSNSCYASMFAQCKSLEVAPVLIARTLTEQCYVGMFNGCTKLKEVACYATDISAEKATLLWLDGCSATGTFAKSPGVNWPSGASGIPDGWTSYLSYIVNFDSNGGSSTTKFLLTDKNGMIRGGIQTPERGGYAFDGWYDSATGGNKIDFTRAISKDMTVYAHWNFNSEFKPEVKSGENLIVTLVTSEKIGDVYLYKVGGEKVLLKENTDYTVETSTQLGSDANFTPTPRVIFDSSLTNDAGSYAFEIHIGNDVASGNFTVTVPSTPGSGNDVLMQFLVILCIIAVFVVIIAAIYRING